MKKISLLAVLCLMGSAHAYEARVSKGMMTTSLDALLEKAQQDTKVEFKSSDFLLIENRNLATSNYKMYVQTNSMIPVAGTAVRIWSNLKTNELILAEMHLDDKAQESKEELKARFVRAKFSAGAMKSAQLKEAISYLVKQEVSKHPTDSRVISMKSKDVWSKGDLVREVEVRARRGVHYVSVSLLKNKVIESSYMEFPQSESITLKANVFPMYEEVEGTGEKLNYEVRELRYINSQIRNGGDAPFGGLGDVKFLEDKYHPLLADTEVGAKAGFWSEASIRKQVEAIVNKLPLRSNNLESGLLLEGKYVTINLHPAIKEAFKGIDFPLDPTTHHMLTWQSEGGVYEAKPTSGLTGHVIKSQEDLLTLVPFRHPEHDAKSYINSGFDEVQVYYGVTALMESLVEMGFTDPELSTTPYHAFLFDPDIGMKDNAYYYDNTINFTTYNPGSPNLARDNPTIWHELGHAVMERLMGSHLGFAGTKGGYGGLSEGMADFVAKIVVEHQTDGVMFPGKNEFRIVNDTGFYLTNEFHDEGEAYGGAMNDMLDQVISYEGRAGLHAFTDLTLEAMRLTRNHPALSAASWFEHMIIADELGSEVRAPGKYKKLIEDALSARNFSFAKDFKAAQMNVKFDEMELTSSSMGSREKPISECHASGVVSYDLKVALTEGDAKFIQFPATVKVEYQKGALQGAIKWIGEENNPQVYSINSADEVLNLPIKANVACETINQPDGSCKDYAYIQIFNQGSAKPIAKKRFYLRLGNAICGK